MALVIAMKIEVVLRRSGIIFNPRQITEKVIFYASLQNTRDIDLPTRGLAVLSFPDSKTSGRPRATRLTYAVRRPSSNVQFDQHGYRSFPKTSICKDLAEFNLPRRILQGHGDRLRFPRSIEMLTQPGE